MTVKKHPIREIIKDAVIVLLSCSIILLTLMAMPAGLLEKLTFLRPVAPLLGMELQEQAAPVPTTDLKAAAKPLTVSFRSAAGRMTLQRSAEAAAVYDQWSALLGEALATAKDARSTGEREYLAALTEESIYFAYPGAIPPEALSRWLGAVDTAVTGPAREYALCLQGGEVRLWLSDPACRSWHTDLAPETLRKALGACTPDGSQFLFEQENAPDLAPTTVLEQGTVQIPTANWENPCGQGFGAELASALGFNPYGAGSYTDPLGNTVYTESDRTCTVGTDGTVTIADGGNYEGFRTTQPTAERQIELARSLLQTICGGMTGDAELYLRDYVSENGESCCTFQYILDGVPLYPEAATTRFDENGLRELTVTVRACRKNAQITALMPLPQAAALADPGSRLAAAYRFDSDGQCSVGWMAQ